MSRTLRWCLALAVLAVGAVSPLLPAPAAQALGAPVLIDDFARARIGERTVDLGDRGTNAQPNSFSESGGVGRVVAHGDGNTVGAVTLSYTAPSGVDLTSSGSNAQFFLEMGSIAHGASISITLTDGAGRTVSYGTGIAETGAWNVVLNFYCTPTQTVCFTGSPGFSFADVSEVSVRVGAVGNHGTPSTTAEIRQISTTPLGGAAPASPSAALTMTSPTVLTTAPAYATFSLALTSSGQPVDVVPAAAPSRDLVASDLRFTGTAPGAGTAQVTRTGTGAYTVRLGPITGSGSVAVEIPTGTVRDSWGQVNAGAGVSADVIRATAPTIVTPTGTQVIGVGTDVSIPVRWNGTPTPTLNAFGLPEGLTFTDAGNGTGTITGRAEATSSTSVQLSAVNAAGTATSPLLLDVGLPPRFSQTEYTLRADVGVFAEIVMPIGGVTDVHGTISLRPGLSVAVLPTGLRVFGAPLHPGRSTHDLQLANSYGSTSATLVVEALQPPAITSPDAATLVVGEPGSIGVTTTGYPAPAIAANDLPAWLTLVADGAGTRLEGTPPQAGSTTVTLVASAPGLDGATRTATQQLTIEAQQAPVFTSAEVATVEGSGTVTVTASGSPVPDVSVADLPAWVAAAPGEEPGSLVLTVTDGVPGEHVLTATATNAAGTATQNLTLRVVQAPVLVTETAVDLTLGEALDLTVGTQGFPAPTLTGVDLPAWATLTDHGDGTATLTGTPPTSGPLELALLAANEAGELPVAVTLEVFEAPVIDAAPEAIFTAGSEGTFSVQATGYPVPALAVEGALPDGLTFTDHGDGTGTLAGTPTTTGTSPIALVATSRDVDGGSVVVTAPIAVEVRALPVITSPEVATVEGSGTVTLTASGYPVPDLSVADLPSWVTAADGEEPGSLVLTVTDGVPGEHALTVSAVNTAGTASQQLTLRVTRAPVLVTDTAVDLTLGEALDVLVGTQGFPAPTLSGLELPAWATLTDHGDGTATLAGTPPTSGVVELGLVAANEAGDLPITVQVRVFEAPAITSPDEAVFAVDVEGSVAVTTTGFPAPAVAVTGDLPAGLTFTDAGDGTAVLAGLPTQEGTSTVTVVATSTGADGQPRAVSQELRIEVRSTPVFTSPDVATVEGSGTVTVTAVGHPVPQVSAGELPAWASAVPGPDGTLTITVTDGEPGEHLVPLTATSVAGTGEQTLTLRVLEAPALPAEQIGHLTAGAPGEVRIAVPGWPAPELTLEGDLPEGVTATLEPGLLVLTGTPATPGDTALTLRASNEAGDAEGTVVLRSQAAPDLRLEPVARFVAGEAGEFPVTASGWPVPALGVEGDLPEGLEWVDNGDGTALLRGTPTTAGTTTVTVVATSAIAPVADVTPVPVPLRAAALSATATPAALAAPEPVSSTVALTIEVAPAPVGPTPPVDPAPTDGSASPTVDPDGDATGGTGAPGDRATDPIAQTGAPGAAALGLGALLLVAAGAVLALRRRGTTA